MTMEKFVHPNVLKWIKTNIKKKQAAEFEKELHIFLQDLWGPLVNYNFKGLKGGYPMKSFPFFETLYIYDKELKFVFEFVGEAILEGKCSSENYSTYLNRRNLLFLNDWSPLVYCIDNLLGDLKEEKEGLGIIYARQLRNYMDDNTSYELV